MKFFKQILFCLIITICTAKGGLFKKKTGNQLKPREFEDFEMKLPEMNFSLMRADMVLKAPKQREFEGLQNGQKLLETDFPYLYQEITQAPETTATGLDEVITISSTESISTSTASLDGMDFKQICGRRNFQEPRTPAGAKSARIIGGENSTFGRWPWQISLGRRLYLRYRHRCGAALLNENWAITAAHCVETGPIYSILLRLGEYDLAGKEERYTHQERRVHIVVLHPQYDTKTAQYDLALLRFDEPVVFQPHIIPVCVPQNDDEFIGKTAYVTGWGKLYKNGPSPSVLQEVPVPVISNNACEAMYRTAGHTFSFPHIFLCAGWEKGGYDPCDGDTGGPMVLQRDDGRFVLAGIVSFGFGCARPSGPTVYTRISEVRDWINQILQFYLYQEITAAATTQTPTITPTITKAPETTTTTIEASTTVSTVNDFCKSFEDEFSDKMTRTATTRQAPETTPTDYQNTRLDGSQTTFDDDDYEVIQISSTESISTSTASFDGMDYKQICGRRNFQEPRIPAGAKSAKIVGGENSTFGRWPWQIYLRQPLHLRYRHRCGAALLNENWAITAAHCVETLSPSEIILRLGEYDLAEEEERYTHQERRVHIVVLHPQYDIVTSQYDLALLRFHELVVFQPHIIPVCVPQTDDEFIGKTAYVTGWGKLYENGQSPSVLQEVSVPVISNNDCEAMYRTAGHKFRIPHIFICAGWEEGGYDPCDGDSGGPMVLQRDDGRFVLAGIVSWGIGCARPNRPSVYIRISEFRDWINKIIQL